MGPNVVAGHLQLGYSVQQPLRQKKKDQIATADLLQLGCSGLQPLQQKEMGQIAVAGSVVVVLVLLALAPAARSQRDQKALLVGNHPAQV
jgi:hypothetical protein